MPLYVYECENCGATFERRQGYDDEPVRICPECEGPVHRLITSAGLIFKGSGFYSTDNKASSPTSKSDTKEKSSSEKSAETTATKSEGGSNGKKSSAPEKTAASSTEK